MRMVSTVRDGLWQPLSYSCLICRFDSEFCPASHAGAHMSDMENSTDRLAMHSIHGRCCTQCDHASFGARYLTLTVGMAQAAVHPGGQCGGMRTVTSSTAWACAAWPTFATMTRLQPRRRLLRTAGQATAVRSRCTSLPHSELHSMPCSYHCFRAFCCRGVSVARMTAKSTTFGYSIAYSCTASRRDLPHVLVYHLLHPDWAAKSGSRSAGDRHLRAAAGGQYCAKFERRGK